MALQSINNIFKDKLFRIPDYQRGYAWSTKQLKDFWEDIINLPPDRKHYTGVLSLKEIDRKIWKTWNNDAWLIEDEDLKPCHVVDGQQRLTTIAILINCIINLIEEKENGDKTKALIGSSPLEEIRRKYISKAQPPSEIVRSYKFGYEEDNPSFQFLKHEIFGEQHGGTIEETFYTLNLENSQRFFRENLINIYKEDGKAGIESIFNKVTKNLKFNVYEIDEEFDVFVAFETMNNRGKQLSNLELLKNRLIYLTTLYDKSELKNNERNTLREKINKAWKEVYKQLGRNKDHPLNDDDFLIAHWIMYFQYSRQKGDDYIRFLLDEKFTPQAIYDKVEVQTSSLKGFQEVIDSNETDEEIDSDEFDDVALVRSKLTPKEIEKYVSSLQSAAIHWYNVHFPTKSNLPKEEKFWLERINRLGAVYFRPLITASYLVTITSAQRVKLFEEIERFIFIVFRFTRAISSYRNSEFYRAARALVSGEKSVEDITTLLRRRQDYINYESEDGNWYLDYGFLQKHIQKKYQSGGGYYYWNGLRYFLYEYEMEKIRERGSEKIEWSLFVKSEKDKVSIEHIYPQTPTDQCWADAFNQFTDKQRQYLKGSLGNLVPLSLSINSSLQNDCFNHKKNEKLNENGKKIREGYDNGSHSEIEVSKYTDWTASQIVDRGIKLLRFLERRWNVKFENEEVMKKLLFLDFLKE